MSDENRGRLDSAIDRAVRGMTQVDPRPGLRHRVTERLHAPARRGSWWLPALAVPALGALVLLAIVLSRSPQPQPQMDSQVATFQPAPAPPSPSAQPRGVVSASEPPRAAIRRPHAPGEAIFGPRRNRVTAASIGATRPAAYVDPPFASPPIPGAVAPLAPITIAPIQLEPISIAPLTVTPLPIRK